MTHSDALWHSLDAEEVRTAALLRPVSTDSRSKLRFPIDLPFRYQTIGPALLYGAGRVVGISSSQVTAACRHQIMVGTPMELVIVWPTRRDGWIPIHLIMSGRVACCDMSGFTVASCQYRFELAGRTYIDGISLFDEAPRPPASVVRDSHEAVATA